MKGSRVIPLVLLLLVAGSAFAQQRSVDVSGFYVWADPTGDTQFNDFDLEVDSTSGFGGAINVFWSNRVSTEFAASVIKPEATLRSSNPLIPALTGGELEMIPITVILQFHFAPRARFDPYVGAGAAYVLFDDLDSTSDLGNIGISSVDIDDDVGLVLNAGMSIDLTRRLALYLDGKYVPITTAATAVFATGPGREIDIDINPLILSVGLSFQF
ncbi:MAG TPA: OmpW family outer membrane protein [Thermoanaerobaculia bacterium]|nr:OmpW family outer membrane protein [Thermoanaerobaculia bacterium]